MTYSYLEIQKEDPSSFETLFNEHRASLIRFALTYVKDDMVAEDIVTEVFIKFWNKQADFDNAYAIKVFLKISTRNACVNYMAKREKDFQLQQQLSVVMNGTEDHMLNQMVNAEVLKDAYQAMQALPKQCGKIMHLAIEQGHNNRAIAQQLNLSVRTVRNQKARGMMLLQRKFFDMQLE